VGRGGERGWVGVGGGVGGGGVKKLDLYAPGISNNQRSGIPHPASSKTNIRLQKLDNEEHRPSRLLREKQRKYGGRSSLEGTLSRRFARHLQPRETGTKGRDPRKKPE